MDPRVERTRSAALGGALQLMLGEGVDAVTHTRVADRSGVGRRTLYRHWPNRIDLLHDTLAGASFPAYELSGDPREDVRTHLLHRRAALVDGPLAVIVMALGERGATDPELAILRDRLVDAGRRPLRDLLRSAVRSSQLALPTAGDAGDEGAALEGLVARLEGPLFYLACIRGQRPGDAFVTGLVDDLPWTRPAQGNGRHNT